MAHRGTEGRNAIADEVAKVPEARVIFDLTGGGHQVAIITLCGRSRKQFFASSPSCRHAHKNAARMTRHILQELAELQRNSVSTPREWSFGYAGQSPEKVTAR
jgi:hypothetical protein